MRRFYPFILGLLILLIISSGCIQVSEKTRASGNALAGYEITEHIYLYGDRGPLTKEYDVRIWALGVDVVREKGVSEATKNAYLRSYNEAMKAFSK